MQDTDVCASRDIDYVSRACVRAFWYVFFKCFQMSALQRTMVLGNIRSEREADIPVPDTLFSRATGLLKALSLEEQEVKIFSLYSYS